VSGSENRPLLVVLHGPNLDMLGRRPVEHYGVLTLGDIEEAVRTLADAAGWDCLCRQTNHEGVFIDLLHEYRDAAALILNPGAWTHYSYAIRDAVELVRAPIAEVHISDISSREAWRRHSVICDVVSFTVKGKGRDGYVEAAERLFRLAEWPERLEERP
jgi:3-dehydroquinate dehydratase-2